MKWAFLAAFGLHLSLAYLLFFHFSPVKPKADAGNTIKAYIKLSTHDIGFATSNRINKHQSINKGSVNKKGNNTTQRLNTHAVDVLHQGKDKQFLLVLHNKLQEYVRNDSANLPGFTQASPATVCFTLNLAGKVNDIKLIGVSKEPQLNHISLQAIQAIQPVKNVQQFIDRPTRFCVEIRR